MVSYFGFNQTLWPFSLPIGLALFIYSFKLKKPLLNITATPLLSPYIQPYSLPLVLFGLLPDRQVTFATLIGMWLILADPRFSYIFSKLIIK
ncbi:MAG: hypothetical protein GYA15_12310 [Leptolinea sp.]|nr:hypothetical protein [Leptolinea sp.]